MPTILGMRGTGSFTLTGQKPQNWRQGILRLYPNGSAPLTAIMSMLGAEGVNDVQYNWYDKGLPTSLIYATAAFAATITSITVDDGSGTGQAQVVVAGTQILNTATGEVMRVTVDPVDVDTIVVARGQGETSAAAITNNDKLYIIGTAYPQGANTPTAIQTDPTRRYNFTQIFRRSLALTRTAMRTNLRTGDAYEEAKLEALELISIDMENAFMYGERQETTQGGQKLTTTRGIRTFISTDADADRTVTPSSGNLTIALMNTYMATLFELGSSEKLALCGNNFLRWLNQLIQTNAQTSIEVTSDTKTYGMQVMRWQSPFGVVSFKTHPLMSTSVAYAGDAVILDPKFIRTRFIDDLKFVKNRQENGTDGRLDEFIGELGLEMHHPNAHMVIKGVTGIA